MIIMGKALYINLTSFNYFIINACIKDMFGEMHDFHDDEYLCK